MRERPWETHSELPGSDSGRSCRSEPAAGSARSAGRNSLNVMAWISADRFAGVLVQVLGRPIRMGQCKLVDQAIVFAP